jgi:putative transposase
VGYAFHQLYYHFAWATHSRAALIRREYRTHLLAIDNEEAQRRGGWPIRHNVMRNHVHLLVRLPPTVSVSDFIGQVKGATAHRVNEEIKPGFKLTWQKGYGALTLRKGEVEKLARFIDNQETHHANRRLSMLLERVVGDEDDQESE